MAVLGLVASSGETRLIAALERARAATHDIDQLLSEIQGSSLGMSEWQSTSAAIGIRLAELEDAANVVNRELGLRSAQMRLLTYLQTRVGQVVGRHELRGVSMIFEWARRIRELRVEQGWPISSNITRADLRPGEYVLEAMVPDEGIARSWRRAKEIRGSRASGKAKGLAFLQAVYPDVADKEQLSYVMKIQSYARRLRELAEEGWDIRSNIDDATLPAGAYRLGSLEQAPPRARKAIKLRHQILERDGFRCRDCGRSPDSDGVTLQVHHLLMVKDGGENDPDNLVTVCADDHAGRHAVAGGTTRDELLDPASESRMNTVSS